MSLKELPNPKEVVGWNFDGMIFCKHDYFGKDKSQEYTYAQACIDKNLICAVCRKHLRKVAEEQ